MIELRKAKEADAAIIALLGRITFTESFGHLFQDKNDLRTYYDRTFTVEKIKASIGKANNVFYLALADNLPVGYAKLKLNASSTFIATQNVCQLQKIYVLQDFLSKKIGHQLQSLLLDTAIEKGFDEIWLSVYQENKRAIRFYEKGAFVIKGTHQFQIGKEEFDFFVMSKSLRPENKK